MTEQTTEHTEANEEPQEPEQTTETPEGTEDEPNGADEPQEDAESFPRAYVERLRRESAGYRERAQQADALAERLHIALVRETGRLADPTDLPFDAEHLADEDALTAAIDELLNRKPHLASRRVSGNVGQGASANAADVDLAGMLRARA